MHIHLRCRTDSLHRPYDAIVLVHDDAMAARPPMVLMTLKEADVVCALILADVRVVCRGSTKGTCTGPNKLSIVVVDVRSGICVPIWCQKDVAWG